MSGPAAPLKKQRLYSLDAFRGATIAAMILVNNPGSWSHIFPPLEHASWNGWTPTDLVFPFFLFIVGVALVFSLNKRIEGNDRSKALPRIFRRTVILFLLGLFLNGFPFFTFSPHFGLHSHLAHIRIPGVLQRIALCYLGASLLFLYVPHRKLPWITAGILLGYWALMGLVPAPGAGAPGGKDANPAAWLDRLLLGGHLWAYSKTWDPEGILSTFPALVTTLFGVSAGRMFFQEYSPVERTARLMVRGALLVVLGYVWNWFFPINKNLWTSSYAVFTAGQAFCALGLFYWFADVHGKKSWTFPLVVYGRNAITVFVMSGVLGRLLVLVHLPGGAGRPQALKTWIFQNIFLSWLPPVYASLAYALAWVGGWYLVLLWMYKRNLFLKV